MLLLGQRAFRSEEGRARLVRRWLAGESEKDIGRSLGYARNGGAPVKAAILCFVNGQLPDRGYRLRCERGEAREALRRCGDKSATGERSE
jgi:hypothetical protein